MAKIRLSTKSLQYRLRHVDLNDSNVHRIAISNLQRTERKLERWWAAKYGIPTKPYQEHTIEELLIEYLEDYYEQNPKEVAAFETKDDNWQGEMPAEYEEEIQDRLKKINAKNKVDVSKYQTDSVLSSEEEKKVLDGVKPLRADEFEDVFGA